MAGIYIHIPFCRKACHYCNFYFSLSLRKKDAYIDALCCEISMRKSEISRENEKQKIETIYFGGGTPSLFSPAEIEKILRSISDNCDISPHPEMTIECNPENITDLLMREYKSLGINRLSIGIQSFFAEDLAMMNRSHTAEDAFRSLDRAQRYFENISADLMFHLPLLTEEKLQYNVNQLIERKIPHISTYNLTVEEKTALAQKVKQQKIVIPPNETSANQYVEIIHALTKSGYRHYEISNFAQNGFESKHNSSYWFGVDYLGFGAAAHSKLGNVRKNNIANLNQYIEQINQGILPETLEVLDEKSQYNEWILTRLRTDLGINGEELNQQFDAEIIANFHTEIAEPMAQGHLEKVGENYRLTLEGKLWADRIAEKLMIVS